MNAELNIVSQAIHDEIEISDEDIYTDQAELLDVIASRVQELLDTDAGLLFSYLYRLDVSESKVKEIIHNSAQEDTISAIAKLIFDRQLQRVRTKKSYVQKPIQGWEW